MKNVYDNLTLKVGDSGEFSIEDGRHLYLKGEGAEGDVEMFMDAEYELRYEDQVAIQDVLHKYCMELRDVLRKAVNHRTLAHHENMINEELKKEVVSSQTNVRLIQLNQHRPVEKPKVLN